MTVVSNYKDSVLLGMSMLSKYRGLSEKKFLKPPSAYKKKVLKTSRCLSLKKFSTPLGAYP